MVILERRTESSGKYWTLGTDNGGLSSRSGLHLDLGSHGVLDNDCPGNPGWGWLPPGQLWFHCRQVSSEKALLLKLSCEKGAETTGSSFGWK